MPRWQAGIVMVSWVLVACGPASATRTGTSEPATTTPGPVAASATAPPATAAPNVAASATPIASAATPAGSEAPAEAVLSEQGLFRAWYASDVAPPPVNDLHAWTLHVETAAGEPVENASITVDGDMPAHGHGLPTQPRVTEALGGGDYRVEGMKFSMGGAWVITFAIEAGEMQDSVTFELELE
jgi:hypothetical protein